MFSFFLPWLLSMDSYPAMEPSNLSKLFLYSVSFRRPLELRLDWKVLWTGDEIVERRCHEHRVAWIRQNGTRWGCWVFVCLRRGIWPVRWVWKRWGRIFGGDSCYWPKVRVLRLEFNRLINRSYLVIYMFGWETLTKIILLNVKVVIWYYQKWIEYQSLEGSVQFKDFDPGFEGI